MKRFTSFLIAAVMLLSLAACSNNDASSVVAEPSSSSTVSSTSSSKVEATATPEPTAEPLKIVEAAEGVNLVTGESTLSKEANGKRAVAIMINNIKDCLPQYGISDADLIFEIPVEYNITRMMAVYGDYSKIPEVCSIRSCRYYYPQIAMGYDAKYLHVGIDDTYALPIVEELGIDNIDGGYDNLGIFIRDQDRINAGYAYEHTMYIDGEVLEQAYNDEAFRTDLDKDYYETWFDFGIEEVTPVGDDCTDMVVNFSDAYYSDFTFNEETGTYFKEHSGSPHMDQRSEEQLNFKNVVVLETYIGIMPGDDYGRRKVDMIVENARGYYISNGKVQEIRWTKTSEDKPIELTDLVGNPLVINQGKTFVAVTNADTFVIK